MISSMQFLKGILIAVPDLVGRAKTLQASKDNVDFKETIESLARVLNIAEKAEECYWRLIQHFLKMNMRHKLYESVFTA